MRYFLDTEYNGFGGQLISMALVPEHGDQEYYAVLPLPEQPHPWVATHVLPYLAMVPPALYQPMDRIAAGVELAHYLAPDPEPEIVADWPDDIMHFCSLLSPAPGEMIEVDTIRFELLRTPGFSTAANSRVPHNALHDARSLRAFVLDDDGLAG